MADNNEITIPVVAEAVTIGKRSASDGKVRVSTRTETFHETVDVALETERVEVTRVAKGHQVAVATEPRIEGELTVIPVFEERLVVEKRLFLVEEVHIRRIRTTDAVSVPVELRKQSVTIENIPVSIPEKDESL